MKTRPLRFYENYKSCWICFSHKTKNDYKHYGYTRINRNGKIQMLHRYMYEKHIGPIPAGALVLHMCDNPSCNNPDHLFLGTQKDNVQDMKKKGRGNWRGHQQDEKEREAKRLKMQGAKSHSAKITEEQAKAIKYATIGCRKLHRIYPEISMTQILRIRSGKRWAHI